MADFDNGLPPTGTTTDSKVEGVSLQSEIAGASFENKMSAIIVEKSLFDDIEPTKAGALLLDKKEAGSNRTMFL